MSPITLAIVGVGYWGPKLIKIFQSLPGVSVVALCDVNKELLSRVAADTGFSGALVADFDLLFRGAPDAPAIRAIVLATPPKTHSELAGRALRQGKHVFVEKPLATSYADALHLARIAEESGLVLFTDHTFVYDEALLLARKMVLEDALGSITYGRFSWLGARQKPQGPDVLWDSGPHAFAALQFFLPARPVSISMRHFLSLPTGVPSALGGRVMFGGAGTGEPPLAEIALAWKDQIVDGCEIPKSSEVILQGTKGAIRYEGSFEKRSLAFFPSRDAATIPASSFQPVTFTSAASAIPGVSFSDEPLKTACRAFIESIRTRTSPATDGKFAAGVVRLLESAVHSLAEDEKEISL